MSDLAPLGKWEPPGGWDVSERYFEPETAGSNGLADGGRSLPINWPEPVSPAAGVDSPDPIEVVPADVFCAQPDPLRAGELLGPLLVRGHRTVIGGHTGEGKTTLALQLVRAAVLAQPCFDWTGAGGRALVLDAEQGERTVRRRLREAGLDTTGQVEIARVPDGLALDRNYRDVAAVETLLAKGRYDVVLLDPLYKLHSGDSNDERQDVDLMRTLHAWRARYGFALLLLVHCRKPEPGTRFSIHDLFGSTAYVRGAEVVLGLQRLSDGYGRLHFLKDRDGDLPSGKVWGLLFDREQGFRRDPDDRAEERDLEREVRGYLAEHHPGWRTAREVAAPRKDGGIGANRNAVEAVLEALHHAGEVEREIGPEGRNPTAVCYRLQLAQPSEPPEPTALPPGPAGGVGSAGRPL